MGVKDIVNKIERYYKKKRDIEEIIRSIGDDGFDIVITFILNDFIKKNSKLFRWFLKKIYDRWFKNYMFFFKEYYKEVMEKNKNFVLGMFGKKSVWIGRRFMFYLYNLRHNCYNFGDELAYTGELYSVIKKEINKIYLKKSEVSWIFEI
jgi:hypothetical protein